MRNKKDERSSEAEDSGEETDEEAYAESEWDELDDQDFAERLAEIRAIADNPNDLYYMYSQVLIKDYRLILTIQQNVRKRTKEADVMSKSRDTQSLGLDES